MKISPARTAAFDILMRIERDGAFSSSLLPQFEDTLSELDASLCHELTLGVLRRKLYLNAIIDKLSKGKRIDLEVRVSLWIGLFQLSFLDRIPAHAAIDESVNLASRARKRSAKGFVNAILRAYQRQIVEPRSDDPIEAIGISTSHPKWLIERWVKQFGLEPTIALCNANNERPRNVFRAVDSRDFDTIQSLIDEGLVSRSEYVDGALISDRSELLYGLYSQDEGSQFVAKAVIAEGGQRVLDVCAAPGGKTAMIAEHASFIVAGDVHRSRLELLHRTCDRLNVKNVLIVQMDARMALPFKGTSFDLVFVDAPCSGTGTIRHNPEIRYSLRASDIDELSRKQRLILQNASEQVREGGKLVYSTCSLEYEENEAVCNDFETATEGFERIDPKVPKQFLTEDQFARTFPHRDDMDGFFIAVFARKCK